MSTKPLITFVTVALFLTACSSSRPNQGTGGLNPGSQIAASTKPLASNKQVKLDSFSTPPKPSPSSPTCSSSKKIAVYLVIDNSSSMSTNNRMQRTKEAVSSFVGNLQDSDIIGISRFSGPNPTYPTASQASELMAINTYSMNKNSLPSAIQSLKPEGTTHMRTGLAFAQSKMRQAKPQYTDYSWVVIFISDGIPEVVGEGIPAASQIPLDVASALKSGGYRIISIGLDITGVRANPRANEYPGGGEGLVVFGKNLLRSVASSPSDSYENTTAEQLSDIYESIATSLCR